MVSIAAWAIAFGALGWWWFQYRSQPIAIAVLPLDNLSHDPTRDYFADGLTDDIIRNLSQLEGLAVRSQTSSFAFKGKPRNVHEAGRQLGVDYILEGNVLLAGDKLRVNTQLVRVRDDLALWSGHFDRKLTDVFAIQDEISLATVNQLRLKLGRGRRRYKTSVEAYDLYLRARAVPQPGIGGSGIAPAIELFQQAIAKDAGFAPAYAGLGTAYARRSVYFPPDHPPDELAKMRSAAERATQLDPLLAEAHDALGMAYARDGQWQQAEAIQLLHIAERADPLSARVQTLLANALISLGRYDEAAEHCLKVQGNDAVKSQNLGRARLGQGRIGEALQILSGDPDLPNNPLLRGFLGYAYARSGRRDVAERMAASSNYPNEQALLFAGLCDKGRTLAALDRMAARGAQRVGTFLHYPELALLRGDPRLKALPCSPSFFVKQLRVYNTPW